MFPKCWQLPREPFTEFYIIHYHMSKNLKFLKNELSKMFGEGIVYKFILNQVLNMVSLFTALEHGLLDQGGGHGAIIQAKPPQVCAHLSWICWCEFLS